MVFLIDDPAGNNAENKRKKQAFDGAQDSLGRGQHLLEALDKVETLKLGAQHLGCPQFADLQPLGQKGQKAQGQQNGHKHAGNFKGKLDAEIIDVFRVGIEFPRMAQKVAEQKLDVVGHGADPGIQNGNAPHQTHGLAELWRFGNVAFLTLFANAFARRFLCSAWILLRTEHAVTPLLSWRSTRLTGDKQKICPSGNWRAQGLRWCGQNKRVVASGCASAKIPAGLSLTATGEY